MKPKSPVADGFLTRPYKKPSMRAAIRNLNSVLEPLGIGGSEAALRWIYFHSALGEADHVILDSTLMEHIEQNLRDIVKGPLPESVIKELQSLWKAAEKFAP